MIIGLTSRYVISTSLQRLSSPALRGSTADPSAERSKAAIAACLGGGHRRCPATVRLVSSFRLPRRDQPASPQDELQSGFPSSGFHRNAFVKRLGILQILAAMLRIALTIILDDQRPAKESGRFTPASWEQGSVTVAPVVSVISFV